MLIESYVAAIQASGRPSTNTAIKDIGIQFYEFQPTQTPRSVLKKSSTPTRCLAVSSTHVFAAQTDKAVVHVYSREKGNQEAVVPFHERIHSLALAGEDGGILVLGTEGGKLILWEICTGRQVISTASHLQPVISIAIDPTNNCILSASSDSNVHVWSLPGLLSFSQALSLEHGQAQLNAPIRTLSNHRTAITDIVVGHSHNRSNIAVSVSKDKTANVWDYQTGALLHTYLLPAVPTCLALDPADRAVYVGYEDGSASTVDFTKYSSAQHVLYDASKQYTPTQILPKDIWPPPSAEYGALKSLGVSYDGTYLISGHESGKIATWDTAKGRYSATISDMGQPVTNINMLQPTGSSVPLTQKISVPTIVKPRFDHGGVQNQPAGSIPPHYTVQALITSSANSEKFSSFSSPSVIAQDEFQEALFHSSIPDSLLAAGLAELSTYNPSQSKSKQKQSTQFQNGDADTTSSTNGASLDPLIAHSGLSATTPEDVQKLIAKYESIRRDHADKLLAMQRENGILRAQIAKSEAAKIERGKKRSERARSKREAWTHAIRRGQDGDKAVREIEMADGTDDDDEGMSSGTEASDAST